jgi:hypothetical protein
MNAGGAGGAGRALQAEKAPQAQRATTPATPPTTAITVATTTSSSGPRPGGEGHGGQWAVAAAASRTPALKASWSNIPDLYVEIGRQK